jgi:hypothetical protein
MLKAVDYQFEYVTPYDYLNRNPVCEDFAIRVLTKYLMEASLMDHQLAALPPSLLNAGAAMAAGRVRSEMNQEGWVFNYFNHDPTTVVKCTDDIVQKGATTNGVSRTARLVEVRSSLMLST